MIKIRGMYSLVKRVGRDLRNRYYTRIGRKNTEKLAKMLFKKYHGREMNLDCPVELGEKINWLKFRSNTEKWSELTDKYAVRKYVQDSGLGHTLNDLYEVYDRVEDIHFDTLPDSFVLKSTNGGDGKNVLIVKEKERLDIPFVKKELEKWFTTSFGLASAEPHYQRIKPRIIAEKYLKPQTAEDLSLVDYKFYCLNGKVYSVFLCCDRIGKETHYAFYDKAWNFLPGKILSEYEAEKVYPRPRSFDKMVEYSEILAKEFPIVRVDWYEIDGEPVFGEMTFTPAAGFLFRFTKEYLVEMGEQVVLPS